jgi:hypothetical protein
MTIRSGVSSDGSSGVMRMTETSFRTTHAIGRKPRQALLTLVREGCEMLLYAHPSVVEGVTLSRTLDDSKATCLVRRMALRLAEEYGVAADVTTNGSAITIRLSRDGHHIQLRRSQSAKGTEVQGTQ